MPRVIIKRADNGKWIGIFDATIEGVKKAIEACQKARLNSLPWTVRIEDVFCAGYTSRGLSYGDLARIGVLERWRANYVQTGEEDFTWSTFWKNINPLVAITNERGKELNYGDEPEEWEK